MNSFLVGKQVSICARTPFIPDGVATVTAVQKDGSISVRFPNGAVYSGIQSEDYVRPEAKSADTQSKRMAYCLVEYLHDYMTAQGHVVGDIITQFDADGDGHVSEDELCRGMASITGGRVQPAMLAKAMNAIDTDGDKLISIHELDKALHEAHSEPAPRNSKHISAHAR
eukprot:COSAG02_NODE_3604_length_6492_cov_3.323166_2_plen_169_part_00